mmetsp:Transcript_1507/g.5161  ORF Transcript_1507/g.5161 Transcript_1507/m.5161 type:complete len:244 (+) Transcript_1507:1344-2075(+)
MTSLRPVPSAEEVITRGGKCLPSQPLSFSRASMKDFTPLAFAFLPDALPFFNFLRLSALVKTIVNGIWCSPSQSIQSKSIVWGSILLSTNTKTFARVSRFKKYSFTNERNVSLSDFDTFAYPYPGKSTKYQDLLTRKWLMVLVFPGVLEVCARSRRFVNMLIRDDLPTFDRPTRANSALSSSAGGQPSTLTELMMYSTLLTVTPGVFLCEATAPPFLLSLAEATGMTAVTLRPSAHGCKACRP